MPKSILWLAFYVALVANTLVTASGGADEVPLVVNDHVPITLDQFNKMLMTEVIDEFGTRRLSADDSAKLWKDAISYELALTKEREANAQEDHRRLKRGLVQGLSPFLICDLRYGETGEACKNYIVDTIGTDALVVSKKMPSSCIDDKCETLYLPYILKACLQQNRYVMFSCSSASFYG